MKFLSFGILGGFYFSSRFQPWMKYSWIFANVLVIFVTLVVGNFGYLMSSSTKTFRDLSYVFLTTNLILIMIIFVPFMTFTFKNNIEEVLSLDEEMFFKNIQIDSAEIDKSKGKLMLMLKLQSLTITLYIIICPLFFIYSDDPNSANNLEYYIVANFWLGQTQSPMQYYLIFLAQLVPVSIMFIIAISVTVTGLIIGHEFHIVLLKLQNFLKDASKLSKWNIDPILGKIMHPQIQPSLRQGSDVIDNNRKELMTRIVTAIQAHQSLRRKLKIIQPYIELLFSTVLALTFGNASLYVFIICATDMSGIILFKQTLGIIEVNIALFTLCYAGKLLDDAQKMISLQVFDIPWYYLSPKQRKTVYIFLCQTQKMVQFNGFGMFSMDVPIALQLMRTAFSLFSVLRRVLNK